MGELKPILSAIRRRTHAKGLTVTGLAKSAGISRSHLSRALAEKGQLSTEHFVRVFVALGVWDDVRDAVADAVRGE